MSRAEARSLTDEVKLDAERLWRKLVELYEGGAHEVLGYSSWGGYYKAEFGGQKSRAYQLLDAGRVAQTLGSTNGGTAAPNERQARELVPLLDQPQVMTDAWVEVSSEGPPSAAKVRAVVEERVTQARPDPKQPIPSLKQAAREVIGQARRVGHHYEVPLAAMSSLMRAAGEGADGAGKRSATRPLAAS
jgi:hypothetical protein